MASCRCPASPLTPSLSRPSPSRQRLAQTAAGGRLATTSTWPNASTAASVRRHVLWMPLWRCVHVTPCCSTNSPGVTRNSDEFWLLHLICIDACRLIIFNYHRRHNLVIILNCRNSKIQEKCGLLWALRSWKPTSGTCQLFKQVSISMFSPV